MTMCGRYTLSTPPELLAEHFALDAVPTGLDARYNIAPSQEVPVIVRVEGRGRHLERMRWGLVPGWAQDPSIGHRLINARAETAATKPAFRSAFRKRRCLIPADGFYEWQRIDRTKQPYWIARADGAPLAFAGLWEHWEAADGHTVIDSCTILTCAALPPVSQLHSRMPVILPPTAYTAWLDPARGPDALQALLQPTGTDALQVRRVSREVNNPRNDYDALIAPAG